MNPYERWDDWEWERAAREVGRENGIKSGDWSRKKNGYTSFSRRRKSLLFSWTGSQKKAALAFVFFLLIFFSAKEEDFLAKGVYGLYRSSLDSGDAYASLNTMALQAIGMSGLKTDSVPVDAVLKGKFLPPVSGRIIAAFGEKGNHAEAGTHSGIDVASSLGTEVIAPYRGNVLGVNEDPLLGRVIKLDLSNGWIAVVGNLGEVYVQKGHKVEAGQTIGTVGLSAQNKKPWLHFELRKDGRAANPMPYLMPAN